MTAYKPFASGGKRLTFSWWSYASLHLSFGGTTERGLVCAFIAGLPKHAEKLLQATTRVDNLLISEILAHTPSNIEKTASQVQGWQPQQLNYQDVRKRRPQLQGDANICQRPNHMARDRLRRYESPRPQKSLTCYRCKQQGHNCTKLSGKRARGRVFSASLLLKPHLNGVLPTVTVQIDRVRHTALVDTGCTQTLVCKPCCQMWEKKKVSLLVVGGSL